MSDPQPHSAQWFTDSRDFWWNAHQLAALAARWNLRSARTVLDVGCGIGHWGRALAPHLAPEASLLGIDPEPQWIAEATKRAEKHGLTPRFRYELGALPSLPVVSEHFDFVTCQTVLMHQPGPAIALTELVRALAPGGLLVAAEPDNIPGSLLDPSWKDASIEDRLRHARLRMHCEAGKNALGLGDNSLGRRMPELLHRAGLVRIDAHLCDRCPLLVPPYDTPDQQAMLADFRKGNAEGVWLWGWETTHEYYLAGGGAPELFEPLYNEGLARERALLDRVARNEEVAVYGHSHYVFSARKP